MMIKFKSVVKIVTSATLFGTIFFSLFLMACKEDEYAAPKVEGVEVKTNATFGKILTDNLGKTLYFFSNDFGTTSTCEGGCVTAWPIFHVTDIAVGAGLDKADFGEITRVDGTKQTTYKGWPLYYFQNDEKADDVKGDKANNVWYVAKPDYSVMVASNAGVKYLVAPKGKTLYTFNNDTNNTSACTSDACVANWPPFLHTNEKFPSIFPATDFGTFTRPDGTKQTAYKSKPLYYYKNDLVKGDALGQGLNNGAWLKLDQTRF